MLRNPKGSKVLKNKNDNISINSKTYNNIDISGVVEYELLDLKKSVRKYKFNDPYIGTSVRVKGNVISNREVNKEYYDNNTVYVNCNINWGKIPDSGLYNVVFVNCEINWLYGEDKYFQNITFINCDVNWIFGTGSTINGMLFFYDKTITPYIMMTNWNWFNNTVINSLEYYNSDINGLDITSSTKKHSSSDIKAVSNTASTKIHKVRSDQYRKSNVKIYNSHIHALETDDGTNRYLHGGTDETPYNENKCTISISKLYPNGIIDPMATIDRGKKYSNVKENTLKIDYKDNRIKPISIKKLSS